MITSGRRAEWNGFGRKIIHFYTCKVSNHISNFFTCCYSSSYNRRIYLILFISLFIYLLINLFIYLYICFFFLINIYFEQKDFLCFMTQRSGSHFSNEMCDEFSVYLAQSRIFFQIKSGSYLSCVFHTCRAIISYTWCLPRLVSRNLQTLFYFCS